MEKLKNDSFLITPSLLNSWLYIWECQKNVIESEKDSISIEDKRADAQKKATDDFMNTLKRIPSPTNEYMKAGIEFEEQCYNGDTCISPIIKGGRFQLVGKKWKEIDGINFLLYGRLDVLKGGVIYDIKKVVRYCPQKYKWSAQHGFYLDLFQRAYKFEYLVYDGNKLHTEVYFRDEYRPTCELISQFTGWLKENDLLQLYKEKWRTK